MQLKPPHDEALIPSTRPVAPDDAFDVPPEVHKKLNQLAFLDFVIRLASPSAPSNG